MKDILKYSNLFIVLVTSVVTIATTYFSIRQDKYGWAGESANYINILEIVLTVMITTSALQVLQTLKRNPVSITISLIGYPGIGKTIYLTMLFEELQKNQDDKISFSPYGTETIEKVLTDVNILRNGAWLPRTSMSQVFFYRAYASIDAVTPIIKFLTRLRFQIEFADFAGEYIDEFNPLTDNWLHKTEYFQYVLQSDAVFLGIDSEKFLHDKDSFKYEVNGLIAAVQILAEKKGAIEGKKALIPISILFLKADVLYDKQDLQEELLHEADRLISICRNRFKFVKYFFVSSIGPLKDGKLTSALRPDNIINPLIWLLRKNNVD